MPAARAFRLPSTTHLVAHVAAGRQVPVSVSMLEATPATWMTTWNFKHHSNLSFAGMRSTSGGKGRQLDRKLARPTLNLQMLTRTGSSPAACIQCRSTATRWLWRTPGSRRHA